MERERKGEEISKFARLIEERANKPDAFFSLRKLVLTRTRFLLSTEARYTPASEGESPSAS